MELQDNLFQRTNVAKQYPNNGPTFTVVASLMCAIAAVMVGFRIVQTFVRRKTIGLEDMMAIAALALNVASTVVGCKAVAHGFGRHGRDIKKSGGDLPKALLFFFLFQITYKMVLAFNKLSFLFLYHRVFQIRWFQMICFITIGIVVSGTFSFVIATVFQCVPVHKSWNRKSAGHCINNAAFRWAWASWNTLMDLWVCLMPVPVISRLQMDPGKRAGLLVVFLLGIFVCVTSVIRMHALTSSVATTDPTWGSLPAFVWSAVEASTGLICACLPSLKQPISRCFPNLFQLTRSRSSGNTYEMGKSGAGSNSRNRQHRSSQWKEDWGDKRSTTVSASRLGGRQDSGDSTERIINSGIMRTTDISMKSEGASASLVDQKTAREVY